MTEIKGHEKYQWSSRSRTCKIWFLTHNGIFSDLLFFFTFFDIIFVNDYPDEILTTSSVSQFADDTALWISAYTESFAIYKLQKSLNLLEGWCRKWRVKLNGDKSKLLLIARTREKKFWKPRLTVFQWHNKASSNCKILGGRSWQTYVLQNSRWLSMQTG